MTKAKKEEKFYGTPYKNKDKFRRGDIKLIQQATGLAYISIVQQLEGRRKITPIVEAMADKLVTNNENLISAIRGINVEQ